MATLRLQDGESTMVKILRLIKSAWAIMLPPSRKPTKPTPTCCQPCSRPRPAVFPTVTVQVLSPVRTFWEKATIFHAEYYRDASKPTLAAWRDIIMISVDWRTTRSAAEPFAI